MTARQGGASVQDGTLLYRRIRRDWVVWDDSRGCWRPSRIAFQNVEMSVALGDTLEAMGREPEDVLVASPGEYLVALTAGFVRTHQQQVVRDPVDDEPAHGLVVGEKDHPASRRKKFAQEAAWVKAPTEEAPPPGSSRLP